jgi:uncharacterized protein YneF (UPF0154 family)
MNITTACELKILVAIGLKGSDEMLETLLCIILAVLILLICLIVGLIGFLILYKLINKEPKNELPPISDDERARLELAEKKRLKQEQNFWNYDGFKQE